MKTKIYPDIIFRTPKFSYQADLGSVWDELKDSISVSSASFYELIKDVGKDELDQLPQKIRFTIWKYFNRAKFRPTPYGTFASVGLLENSISNQVGKTIINKKQNINAFIDWPFKAQIERSIVKEIAGNCKVFGNSTYYKTKDGLRYVSYADNVFEISEIDRNELVEKILETTVCPLNVNELMSQLGIVEDEIETVKHVLVQMHELQLLFTENDPNSIGEDYFDRIGVKKTLATPTYILAERETKQSNINQKLLQYLPDLVVILNQIVTLKERSPLANFINRFKSKFDQQEVPFVLALDPEMGVGYEDLEQAGKGDDFVTQFAGRQREKENTLDFLKKHVEQRLTDKTFKNKEPIFLHRPIEKEEGVAAKLPNTFSILLTIADDLIFADTIGGATANALAGRFTLGSRQIETYCKNLAKLEQTSNPEILFFDVSYLAESDVDNINRRKQIYDYQLSLLNFDTTEHPLALNDLMVSVRDTEIILRSKKHNKRVMPRLASAYNYSRSDLSAFRLLCDLQHHGIQTSLSFALSDLFPDLDYYPRLQYQNIVLSAEKWKIDKDEYQSLLKDNLTVEKLRAYLKKKEISKFFKTGLGDQTLCFNLETDEDLNAFMQFMHKKESLYVEEVVIPLNTSIEDEYGNPYMAQYNLSLYHNEEIYKDRSGGVILNDGGVKQVFELGEEWLYFEIYCHQQRMDELLVNVIADFTAVNAKQIELWFFIRYNENGDHLRFRMKLTDASKAQKITHSLMLELKPYLNYGLISDVQSKMYRREIERYGAKNIIGVENLFSVDSRFVIDFLSTNPSDFDKYSICIRLIRYIKDAHIFEPKDYAQLIKQISNSFNDEHHLEAHDFKKLNEQYQNYRKEQEVKLNQIQQKSFSIFCELFQSVLMAASGEDRAGLFHSLFHMYVNRLFSKDQRVQEMIVYYFSIKDMQRQEALSKMRL